jgi:outer membrane protein OmpA-like peptidoglycan-associated protein
MKKSLIILASLGLGLAATLPALDMNSALDSASKAASNPKGALQGAGNAATDKAMAELTKKLKNVQNEYGPIVFVSGKADLEADKCERTLKAMDGIIKQYPGFKVQVEGYTDNKGKAAANLSLSQKRAEAVVAWLSSHLHTPSDRMAAKGFGDASPIASNKTAAGRAKNRRVDFSVTRL